jgi:hypothetical protein
MLYIRQLLRNRIIIDIPKARYFSKYRSLKMPSAKGKPTDPKLKEKVTEGINLL